MGDAEEVNLAEVSDQDEVTPPVVNNTIVHKEKSKHKSKISSTERSKDKSKTSTTEKSKDKSKANSTDEKSSKKSRRNSGEESGKGTTDGVKVSSPSHPEKVKVIVRCRPISSKELEQGHIQVVKVDPKKHEIEVHRHNPSSTNLVNAKHNKIFTFDNVFDERSTQADLYEEVFRSLVDSVLEGFNGTIFAYGQTGTGKTYTMEGIRDSPEHQGVIPQAFKHIFAKINAAPASQTYLVRASYLEIYQEEIRDLLFRGKTTCELKESGGGVYVKDLSTNICRNFEEINEVMSKGNKNRSVGATNMNEHSSRSHAIFVITVEMSEMWDDGATHIKVGKLNLVDLAGSERQGKTGSEGDRLKEAVKINLSLSALGHVIGALAEGGHSHIPYRDSKLTRLLQDSLGGNSRTIMVATIGPASFNYDETMVTLRYASRAKRIKNKPKVNEDPKDAMLKMYQDEIAKLKAQLEAKMKGQPSPRPGADIGSPNLDQLLGSVPKHRPKSRRPIATARALANEDFDPTAMKELSPYLSAFGLETVTDPKEILRQLEKKKKALLMDSEKNQEEKNRIVEKLEETEKYVRRADDACARIRNKIEWLESKTLNNGNQNKKLVDRTNKQQKEIEIRKKELDEEARAEDELRTKLDEHSMSMSELKDLLSEKEADYAHKKRKLEKVRHKLGKLRETKIKREEKMAQVIEAHRAHLKKMQKEVKGSTVIMDNFVPPKMKAMLEDLIRQNKNDYSCTMLPISSVYYPRPMVDRMLATALYRKGKPSLKNHDLPPVNLYFTDENILKLHFDGPRPTTLMYTPPDNDPYISSLLQRALEDAESEVVVDCARFNTKRRRKQTAKLRLSDVMTGKGDLTVRQVLSSKHRSKEIIYKDYVVVARARPIPVSRVKTGVSSQRSIQSQQSQIASPT